MTLPEREAMPGIGPRRAEIIVAGAEVYAELLETSAWQVFAIPRSVCAMACSRRCWRRAIPAPAVISEFEHERWESVLATARRYGVDPRQAEPVRAHAVQLYRELKTLHALPRGV